MLASAEDSRVNGWNKYEIIRTFEYVGNNSQSTSKEVFKVPGTSRFEVELERATRRSRCLRA